MSLHYSSLASLYAFLLPRQLLIQAMFVKYYDTVMPLLLSILVGATDKTHRLLRAKALECISLVAMVRRW